ncbi:MAG TPA: tyrosine-type recombinase/integrase [Verrucomicrobiae bacterium]|nr:tyrosine-type recombinase/integrase [Verrucomicrobiae bacterium]
MKASHSPELPTPEAKSPRLPAKWPHVVRNGDVTVKIYKNKGNVRGENFQTFLLSYYANGKRQLRRFVDFAKANEEASRVAKQKAQGALGAAALSASDRVSLQQALDLLSETEGPGNATAPRLVEIVRDYAAARAGLPPGVTLAETTLFYQQKHPANMRRKSVAEVVTEFIADRQSAGCSAVHVRDLETRLGQFAKAFELSINAVNAALVQQWIYGLQNQKTRRPAAARTKENMLRQITSLFNFARRQKYVPAELALEISEISAPRKKHAPIGIYTSGDMRAILAAADSAIQPALAIAAFAGLRLAEVSRLDWRDVRLAERLIVVGPEIAKTAARRLVPICDNLAAWLTPHARSFGSVNPCQEHAENVGNALGDRFERAAARAKIKWQRNGFRHSYISYRVAVLKDVPAVALECGNSTQVIFSNYRALATDAEAKDWFSIAPAAQENVVPLPVAAAV